MFIRFLKINRLTRQFFATKNIRYSTTMSSDFVVINKCTDNSILTGEGRMDVIENITDAVTEQQCKKRTFEMISEAGMEETNKKPRSQKKKKVAMLLSFCGQGYFGMQINHGFKTIEGELFQAFLKLGIMDEESYKMPQSIHFQRAARTDKGVSAVHQVVSFKMRLSDEDLVSQINSILPEDIHVFAVKKVTGGFNSKTACDGRSYSYLMPSFAFAPKERIPSHDFRISIESLDELNSLLSIFKGTRNYHNFTSGRPPQDPSCKRYVTHFSSSDPFIYKDIEFVKITIKGQSFMLHQIRKMIGIAISIMRGFASKETLENAFKMERVPVPIAPSLNLMLEEPHYESYNRRYASTHEALEWSSLGAEIQKFSSEFILPVIYNGEIDTQNGSMMKWLSTLPMHIYDYQREPVKIIDSGTQESAE